jgi:hypothetical protein
VRGKPGTLGCFELRCTLHVPRLEFPRVWRKRRPPDAASCRLSGCSALSSFPKSKTDPFYPVLSPDPWCDLTCLSFTGQLFPIPGSRNSVLEALMRAFLGFSQNPRGI